MTGTNAHGFKSCLIKIPTSWLNFTISQTLSEVADFVDSCFFSRSAIFGPSGHVFVTSDCMTVHCVLCISLVAAQQRAVQSLSADWRPNSWQSDCGGALSNIICSFGICCCLLNPILKQE